MPSSLRRHPGFLDDPLRNQAILVEKARKFFRSVGDRFERALDELLGTKVRLIHDARDLVAQALDNGPCGARGSDQAENRPA